MQVGHQGNSETIGEHQVGGNCIHYHSVRHGTANECKDDVGHAQGGTYRHTHRLCASVHAYKESMKTSNRTKQKHPLVKDEEIS